MTSRLEQETVIAWNREEDEVSIYTANQTDCNKCKKLGLIPVRVEKDTAGQEVGWFFVIEKIEFRWGKKRQVNMTDEQRAKMAARMSLRRDF